MSYGSYERIRLGLVYRSEDTDQSITGRDGKQVQRCDDPNKRTARKTLLAQGTAKKSTAIDELTDAQKANLKTELRYLNDPLKLANYVHHLVEHDYDKALALVRLSSRAVANTVAWNHLIDSNMRRGKTKAAIDVYSEMKKRAQKPDSYTYLLLLRGLGEYAYHPHSLGRALSLYHSMSAPGNKVAPTIRHTNAILKVCARANDMDSLWDIASKLPERGPHAADNWTFTTILNNLRYNAITGGVPDDETAEEASRRRNEAVVQGCRLWELITRRWRAGDIKIDEELACSIGRLLLVSSRSEDWDNVFSLVAQTMDIPRMTSQSGTDSESERRLSRTRASPTQSDSKDAERSREIPNVSFSTTVEVFSSPQNSRSSQSHPTVRNSSMHAYARPSNSTTSLVLEACLKLGLKKPASQYWDLLTDRAKHAITPDLDNIHMRLRILRQSHSSAEVVHVLRNEMSAAKVKPVKKTFAIAMSACARDSQNPSTVTAAGQVLDLALQHLGEPGAKTFDLYLDAVKAAANVVEKRPPTSTSGVSSDGLENIRTAIRIQLRALSRLEPGTLGLKSMINFGSDPFSRPREKSRSDWDDEVKRERTASIELMKRMISMYDRVVALAQGRERELGLKPADRKDMIARKRKLQAFVQRQHERGLKRQVQGRGWRPTVAEGKDVEEVRKMGVNSAELTEADEPIAEPVAASA